jgi:sec-independent protein translocase protein TatC
MKENGPQTPKKTVRLHLAELRKRALIAFATVAVFSITAFMFIEQLIAILLRPFNEKIYYTNPAGGLELAIGISLTAGVMAALPVIVYQTIAFILPAFSRQTSWRIAGYSIASFLLAAAGCAFAFFLGLPAALYFLSSFSAGAIGSLISAESYIRFVMTYVGASAVLFQLPVVMLLIDSVSPLRPVRLLKYIHYVILGSFIVAAIATPTPDPVNQSIMAGVPIVLYLVSILIIAGKRIRIGAIKKRFVRLGEAVRRRMRGARTA